MAFPRKYLNEGEEIVLEQRPHWSFMFGPAVALVGAVLLGVVVQATISGDVKDIVLIPVLILALLFLVWFASRYARWMTTNFVVTTERLIHRSGVFAKHGREIPLDRLNDISFSRRLIQRFVGSGDLLIESAGERGQQTFNNFSHPERTQNVIYQAIEDNQQRDAERAAGIREPSALEQLEKLEELRQRGVISQAEFEVKKAKLLDRL